MEIATDAIYTVVSLITVFYALSVYRWMRRRVVVARPYGNGRLALAKGARATALRKLLVAIISTLIGLFVGSRDALAALDGTESFSIASLGLRLMFIVMILLVMDSIRITKSVYVKAERHR